MAKILQGMNTQDGTQVAPHVRDYTPGSNDFLSFANTMNKNAQLDIKKDRRTVGDAGPYKSARVQTAENGEGRTVGDAGPVVSSTPSAHPRAIGSVVYGNIRSNFKKVLDDSAKGIETRYESYFKGQGNGGNI